MSNKINTTTGNEVKDMNTTELEGKASSSTSQSGGMSNAVKLLVLVIANLITTGLIVSNFMFAMPDAMEDVTIESFLLVIVIVTVTIAFLAIVSESLANKRKKESETSTEEPSAKVAKIEEVTNAKDEKPSNGLSNAAKALLLAAGVLMTSVIICFGFALLH